MTGRPTKRPVRPAAGQRAVPVPGKTMIRLEGTAARTMRLGHGRLLAVALMFGIGFCVLAGRLVELTVVRGGDGAVANLVPGTIAARPERADIVDRHGLLLATNLSTASLYADAREVLDANRAARRLAKVLPELSLAATAEKLRSDKAFVWLKRNLTPALQDRIHRLGIPGLYFREEQRRLYPHGALAAHVLGFTDVDGNGIAGVEKFFDEELLRRGHAGAPLQLSLDIRVQHALRDELGAAMAKFSAVGAAGLVMNANTGEVLGLASLPDFDPNHPGASPVTSRFNRTSLGVYELGSVFKVFTLAMALDSGTTNLSGSYDASKPIRVSRFTIRDDHPKKRRLSVPEILIYSSNIGAAKMALDVGGKTQRAYLGRFGMLRRPALELPEVGAPLSPSPWRDINTMTVAFGHGLAVSPVQLTSGFAAAVNGGLLLPATLIRHQPGQRGLGVRVIGERTSGQLRRLLRAVVEKGTGGKAEAPGYLVGGKTGTAEKAGVRGYRRRALISSFVAAFPINAPAYVVYVMIDEPKGIKETYGFAAAGWNAAPAAGQVIQRIAPILGVRPVHLGGPAKRQAMAVPGQGGERKVAAN